MITFHIIHIVLGSIVVRFDGSFRVATADGRTRMGSAAATISFPKDENLCERVLYIGGKYLDTSKIKTSGEAEFEGLILGLEGLLAWQKYVAPVVDGAILVRGDCKTAIQHMQGRSRPRKLANLYDHAIALVQRIPWTLQFEHCPRENNVLCDRLCYCLLATKQALVVDSIHGSLLHLLKAGGIKDGSLSHLCEKFLPHGKSLLDGMKRLKLYSILARMAWIGQDYSFLIDLGGQMQKLATILMSSRDNRRDRNTAYDNTVPILVDLKIEGIRYEMAALKILGKEKEILQLARREKATIRRYGVGKDTIGRVLATPEMERPTTIHSLETAIDAWSTDCKEGTLDVDKLLKQYPFSASIRQSDGREDIDTPLASATQRLLGKHFLSQSTEPVPTWISVHFNEC